MTTPNEDVDIMFFTAGLSVIIPAVLLIVKWMTGWDIPWQALAFSGFIFVWIGFVAVCCLGAASYTVICIVDFFKDRFGKSARRKA